MNTGKEERREARREAIGELDPTRDRPTTDSGDSRCAPDAHGAHGAHGAITALEGTWIETVERFARESGIDVLVAGPGTDKKGHAPFGSADRKVLPEARGRKGDSASGIPRIWCVYRERRHGRIMALVLVLENRSEGAVWQPCFQHEGPFFQDIPRALFELLTPPSAWSGDVRKEEPEAVFWYRAAEADVHERAKARARLRGHARAGKGCGSQGGRELAGSGDVSGHDDPNHTILVDVRAEIGRRRLGAGRALGNRAVVRRSRGICENVHVRVKPLVFD